MERRMKMMKKKLLGLGRRRKEEEGRQRPQARSGASSLGGYKVRSRDLGRLHRAAALGDLSELRQLLRKHDRNEQDEAGRTPLHLACANGCTDAVAFLLDCKSQLNIYDSDKRSPLMKAVQCQQEDCAVLLLENGADPNLMDIDKNTALHFAVFNSSISIANHLLDHNAQIEAQNKDGSTPLLVAAAENNQEMAAFLLKKGASVHATDKLGRTALLIAAFNKKRVLTHLLLSYGSDVSHKDDSGWSAHDYAVLSDDPILLQYIAEHCNEKRGAGNSSEDRKALAMLNSPGRASEAGFALGLPAANKEVIDDRSSGDSVRDSGEMDDDSWLSSEEEELDFSPKKPQKQSLAQLINVAQQFKKNLDQKSSLFGMERVASSQQNRSVYDAVDAAVTFPKPLVQVPSFPQPTRSMPGSFPEHFRTSSPLASKQEDVLEEEEGKNQGMNENLICRRSSENQTSSQHAIVREGMEEEEAEEKSMDSPWDSEPKIAKTNLEHDATIAPLSKPEENKEKQKQDLMEELGLDDADDIEDPSDWDSSSISQGVPGTSADRLFISRDTLFPGQLAANSAATRMPVPASIQEGMSPAMKLASKDPLGDEQNTKELDNGEGKGKRVRVALSALEKLSADGQTDKEDNPYGKKTGAEIRHEESEDECGPVDLTLWEERYEKLWVANEKKEVKSNFKHITAELKLKFGEVNVREKRSKVSVEVQDAFHSAFEGITQLPPLDRSKTTISIKEKDGTGKLRSVVAKKELNAENPAIYPQSLVPGLRENVEQNVGQNRDRNDNLSPRNADSKDIDIYDERNDSVLTRPRTDVRDNAISSRKHHDNSVDNSRAMASDEALRTFPKQPRKTDSRNIRFDVGESAAREIIESLHQRFDVGQRLDAQIGNQVTHLEQTPRKELDEELERDVARFKNEVGMLQVAFLALEKEKAQLQKEVEEGKRKLEWKERKEVANLEGKSGQTSPVNENVPVKTEGELKDAIAEERNMISSSDKEASLPIPYKKFSLKQEEHRRGDETLYDQTLDQLRKTEEQYRAQAEEKQQMELRLRSLEVELSALENHLMQVEEERGEMRRQLSQERNARALQEDVLKTHLQRQKELEEEISKKLTVECSEVDNCRGWEEELTRGAQTQQELDGMRRQHEEEASRHSEENRALKATIAELEKALKLSQEAAARTVLEYTGQMNVSKTEVATLASKVEHLKENKESLEAELDSFHSRWKAAFEELDECQASRKDLERTLHRERDEWLHAKDSLDRDMQVLQESNSSLSQRLGRAESKANGLENELQLVARNLREKNLLLEAAQRDLIQAQDRVKELEGSSRDAEERLNKYAVKQDSLQERLAQLQSENLLLRQQHEDFQNKGILKEKAASNVQDKFNDLFCQLRVDNEKLVRVMEGRNEELIAQCDALKEQVAKWEGEKADREGTIRQLQQELADSLKKQSMSEASLEISTRYRIDLEEEKQQLQKEIDRIKYKLQESEERYLQSERCIHDFKRALDSKDHEANVAAQKLQDLLVASSGANNAIKQLEEHIKRLEVENARLEATSNHQSKRIEILQAELKDNSSVHGRLEELITGLQMAQINLEEQQNQQVENQTPHSIVAKDTHRDQEEVKSKSELGVQLSELEREKSELMAQFENEKKKVKKLVELKRSVETRLDQEIKRNSDLQKECNRIKKLTRATRKKLKQYENEELSLQSNLHGGIKNKYSEIDIEMGMLRKKVDELSSHLEVELTRCTQMEAANYELREQLSSTKLLKKNYEELQQNKLHLEEEIVGLKRQVQASVIDFNQVEQYKRDVKERAKQEVTQKLEEVNLFLQTQAASQETLEQVRATQTASLRNQLENKIRDLELELEKLKRSQQDSFVLKESELERYKSLCSEEIKMRKSLGRKLDRANEKLAETNARLCRERHKSKTLLTSTFLSGSLSGSPVLETVQLRNLESSLALNRPLSLDGFINPTRSPLASKSRVDDYLVKMQMELERNISKELEQVNTELDPASARISPIGSVGGASKNLNMEQDQVSKATQQYLDVLKKNYMI